MKSITENLALLTVLAIAISLFRLYAYYDVFGINITSYIDLSEAIQLQYFFMLLLGSFAVYAVVIFLLSNFASPKKVVAAKTKTTFTNLDLVKVSLALLVTMFTAFYVIGSSVRNDAKLLIINKPNSRVMMLTEKDTITTDSTLIFIGRTKGYVFLYNKREQEARVFKSDEIKEFRCQKKLTDGLTFW